MPSTHPVEAPARRFNGRRLLLVGLLGAGSVAVALIVLVLGLQGAGAATSAAQSVSVEPAGPDSSPDWTLSHRATLSSEAGRTKVEARLKRNSASARTPALTADFDGSGGGEARPVTCTAQPQTWTVPAQQMQTVTLDCNTYVKPFAVHQLKYVYAEAT